MDDSYWSVVRTARLTELDRHDGDDEGDQHGEGQASLTASAPKPRRRWRWSIS
jgi:hypothetical protein